MSNGLAPDYFTLAKKRRDAGLTFWKDIFDEFDIDMRLVGGDQWTKDDRNSRENSGRPALQFNRQANNVQLITNNIRSNKPSIRVNPISDATADDAKIMQGIIRHIEYVSLADACRENASEYSTGGGIGHYEMTTRYVDADAPDPFAKEIYLEPILDSKTVLWDPAVSRKLNFRDARWCQVSVKLTWEEYNAEYPDAEHQSWDTATDWNGWADELGVIICKYWRVEVTKRIKYAFVDGTNAYGDELTKTPSSEVIVNKRPVEKRKVFCDLINGREVLETTEWVDDEIPILTVLGKALVVEEKLKLIGIVRNNRDAQQLENAAYSGIGENIGMTNRVPYTGPKGSFKSDKNWGNAHLTNPAFLEYDVVYAKDGVTPLPGPQRQSPEAAIGALSQLAAMMADANKAGSGIYDSSLGSATAEYSGVSVDKRTQQANLTNMHFADNLSRTMWREGNMYLRILPKIIDRPRAMRIIGEDGNADMVPVTMPVKMSDGTTQVPEVPGYEGQKHFRLDIGKYDCVISTAPGYPTRKIEEFAEWTNLAKADPLIMQAAGDQILKNAPYEGAEIISESYLALMPPVIQQMRASKNGKQDIPPIIQAQMSQLQAENQQLKGALVQMHVEKQAKLIEIQSKDKQNLLDNQTKIAVADINQKHEAATEMLRAEQDSIAQQLGMLHESELHSTPLDQAAAQAAYAPPEETGEPQ